MIKKSIIHISNIWHKMIKTSKMLTEFTSYHTMVVKGIATLILCWHHLFWHYVTVPINFYGVKWSDVLVSVTKVCVALFTILSGYGLCASYRKKEKMNVWRFSASHVGKLLIGYWWVYVPAFILSFWLHNYGTPLEIYSSSGNAIVNALLDFFGVRAFAYTPTLNNSWWYIEAAIAFYLLFPILKKMVDQVPIVILALSALPVIALAGGFFWKPFITTDRELYYLFPFVVGMCLARYGILDKIVRLSKRHRVGYMLGCLLLVLELAFVQTQMGIWVDTFYALSIVMLFVSVPITCSPLGSLLAWLGKHSMTIYLLHTFVYYYFGCTAQWLARFDSKIIRYLVFIIVSCVLALIIDGIKQSGKKVFHLLWVDENM